VVEELFWAANEQADSSSTQHLERRRGRRGIDWGIDYRLTMMNVRSLAIILRKACVLFAGIRSVMGIYRSPGLPDDVEAMIAAVI
jgi:hypothetical protein